MRESDEIPSSMVTVPSGPLASASGDRDLVSGALLGEYRIEHKIGRGSSGDVYRAQHVSTGARAAIKILRGDSDPDAVARFIAEAQVVSDIGNSNIVDVFASGTAPDGRAYLVMEWLPGETLRQRLKLGKLDVETACRVARQLVRALGAAHGKRIVHRDVKPDNVFLVAGEPLVVKLLDFGMAKLLRTDRMTQTASGAFVGTPMYVAPEQARGLPIDHRADIYTLGGVLFEMLTGQPPFVARSAFEVISMHMTEPAPRPGAHVDVPPELDELVEAMLAKEPAVRPPLGKIAEVLEGVIDPAERPTTVHGAPPEKARLPIWPLLVVLVLGAAGAFALVRVLTR